MRKASCWRHPAQGLAGVCAPCLRERLAALASYQERFPDGFPRNSSPDSTSSGSFFSIAPAADSGARVEASKVALASDEQIQLHQSGLTETRGSEALASVQSATVLLRRSISWSESKSNAQRPGTLPDGLNLRINDSSKHVSANYEGNSAQSGDFSNKKEAAKIGKAEKPSSWFSSLLRFRIRRGEAPSSSSGSPQKVNKSKSKPQGHISPVKATFASKQEESDIFGRSPGRGWEGEPEAPRYTEIANSWMSGPLPQTQNIRSSGRQTFSSYLKRSNGTKGYECQPTRRVIPLSVSSEGGATWRSEKNSSIKYTIDHRESSWMPWATPLRIFSRKSRKTVTRDYEDTPIAAAAANSWKLSSDHELPRPSPTHPANYSTYYRDNCSLSLHSSPAPGSSRSRVGRRLWDGRSEHFHSSPYMGNSSWNFYLTPVRPIKSSLKQRL